QHQHAGPVHAGDAARRLGAMAAHDDALRELIGRLFGDDEPALTEPQRRLARSGRRLVLGWLPPRAVYVRAHRNDRRELEPELGAGSIAYPLQLFWVEANDEIALGLVAFVLRTHSGDGAGMGPIRPPYVHHAPLCRLVGDGAACWR